MASSRILSALLASTLVTTCTSGDFLGPEAEQGIEGIALIGPQCPVQTEEDPCPDLPYQARVDVLRTTGGVVTRFRTGEDGRFRVGLPPGRYTLVPDSGNPFPIGAEQDVQVTQGAYTEVVISFDTGIR